MSNFHPSATIGQESEIGKGTKVWHYSHIMNGAKIGENCTIGQNVFIASGAVIGNGVKIQNNVSVYNKVVLEDFVFCGPSCVFTNVINPRSEVNRKDEYKRTVVKRGASLGANSTILCGITVGRYAFIGAGATVLSDVGDYMVMVGVPAVFNGWMSRHGYSLIRKGYLYVCPKTNWKYKFTPGEKFGQMVCLTRGEDEPLKDN